MPRNRAKNAANAGMSKSHKKSHAVRRRHERIRVIRGHPGPSLLFSGAVESLCSLHRLHIKICNVPAVWQLDTLVELITEHHIVFEKTTLPIKAAQDSLLERHLVHSAPPALRVVLSLSATLGHTQIDTALRVCDTNMSRWLSFLLIDTRR